MEQQNPFFEAMQHAAAQQQMVHQVHMMSMDSFFDSLDQENMFTLANLLGAVANCEDPSSIASYYEGLLRGVLKERYKVCPTHNVNHDEDAMNSLAEAQDGQAESREAYSVNERLNEIEQLRDDLIRYNVGFIDEPTGDEPIKVLRGSMRVSCVLCGYGYSSMDDRMLKKADACPGCFDKAAHG